MNVENPPEMSNRRNRILSVRYLAFARHQRPDQFDHSPCSGVTAITDQADRSWPAVAVRITVVRIRKYRQKRWTNPANPAQIILGMSGGIKRVITRGNSDLHFRGKRTVDFARQVAPAQQQSGLRLGDKRPWSYGSSGRKYRASKSLGKAHHQRRDLGRYSESLRFGATE